MGWRSSTALRTSRDRSLSRSGSLPCCWPDGLCTSAETGRGPQQQWPIPLPIVQAKQLQGTEMNIEPQLLRKPEAARFLSMPLSTLEKQTARKEIPHLKIGRAVYYDVTDLNGWIDAKKIPVQSESN